MSRSERDRAATVLGRRGAGTAAVLDDGTVVVIPGDVVASSAFRQLRPGQRLLVEVVTAAAEARVARIRPVAMGAGGG